MCDVCPAGEGSVRAPACPALPPGEEVVPGTNTRGQDQEDSSVRDTALDTPGLIVTPIYVKCVCVACSNIIK